MQTTFFVTSCHYYFRTVSHIIVFTFKYYKQRFAFITMFLLLAMLCNTIESQGQIVFHPITRGLVYDLKVSRVDQSPLVEFSPVVVRFKLTISIGGNTGPFPTPMPVRICSKVSNDQTTCYTIDAPILNREYSGTVTAMTSFAGQSSPIRLVVLGKPEKGEDYGGIRLAEGEVMAPVAARYDIAITGFEVVTSRSNQTDTQWFLLQGMVNSDPPHPSADPEAGDLAGFHWVQPPRLYGDAGDGKHVVNDIRVGSYDLVPEREKDLRFLFYVDNIGNRKAAEIAAGIGNGFSKVGLVILSAYSASQGSTGGQSFATQLDNVMEQMHSAATASCDGQLAKGIRIITNTTLVNRPDLTLEALTHTNGTYSETELPS
ncbi:hypothetical protein GXP67_31015 [Rhodocytophaga rosea]|uniref:Uncharacterized protein n=1 Tax=Rhodocytophaga rosea TaxID=2704465 RepID=A0A6C0GRS5_9BACT|nr:hypothetical protein [Rhodocytophaga rosea]QHT70766.1 hypothetical protein GXP67_31015 [Rhodocytophaga rosea]